MAQITELSVSALPGMIHAFVAKEEAAPGEPVAIWNPRTTNARLLRPAGISDRTLHPAGKTASEWNTRVDVTRNVTPCQASQLPVTTRVITEDGDFVITEDGEFVITE